MQGVKLLQNGCNTLEYCTHESIAPTKSSVTSKTWSRSPLIAPRATDELPAAQIQPGDCHLYDWHQDHDHDHEDEHHGLTLEQDSFYHYDTDRDCRISIQEFLLARLPSSLRFADYDANGDEMLTFVEFLELHEALSNLVEEESSEEPSHETYEEPSNETTEVPSYETYEEPSNETYGGPSYETTEEPTPNPKPHTIIITSGGEPVEVDKLSLICIGDYREVFIARKLSLGKYIFEDASLDGKSQCDLVVERDG